MKDEDFEVGDVVKTKGWDFDLYEVVVYVGSEGVLVHRVNNLIKYQLERYIRFCDINWYQCTYIKKSSPEFLNFLNDLGA